MDFNDKWGFITERKTQYWLRFLKAGDFCHLCGFLFDWESYRLNPDGSSPPPPVLTAFFQH